MLGQPSIFRAFILQHHDEVELSCTSPSSPEGGAEDDVAGAGVGEGAASVDVLVVLIRTTL
jgi:hypothetical protein